MRLIFAYVRGLLIGLTFGLLLMQLFAYKSGMILVTLVLYVFLGFIEWRYS